MLTGEGRVKQNPRGGQRARQQKKFDAIPKDPAGQLRDLQKYDFVSPEAKQKFDELLASMRQSMMQPFMQGMQNALANMKPDDLKRMREMMQDLNRMLRQKAEG